MTLLCRILIALLLVRYLPAAAQPATRAGEIQAEPAWARARFPLDPAVGRFESNKFDPVTWVPEFPNDAFINRLADDNFWAAKQVMHFTDAEIRAIVRIGASAAIPEPRSGYLSRVGSDGAYQSVRVYLRRQSHGWMIVGVDRAVAR